MLIELPEIIYGSSQSAESRQISQLVKAGKIKKILPRAYTSNLKKPVTEIIRHHLFLLIAHHYPEALISHRSAIEFAPSPKNNIYLTSTQNRTVEWPGISLKFTKGPGKLLTDLPLLGSLCATSLERALLENLKASRNIEGESRTVPESIVEEKLLNFLNKSGEKGLNELRDRILEIASELGMEKEYEKLNKKISAVLSTAPSHILKSPLAMAQAFGEPYEPGRINLFIKLASALREAPFETRTDNSSSEQKFKIFAFFESYFSNYIEGTTFEIEEAKQIIYDHKIIPNRVGDSHDIEGTFLVCSNSNMMKTKPTNANEFIELLQSWHTMILKGRPDKEPGLFKEIANRAGITWFVPPSMVKGTLKAGFDMLSGINTPLGRALFIMFVVSEVHPFNDGNGRIARIMMNAELVQSNMQRIIIPTVYRDDYIGALRKLTRQGEPDAYIRMMERIQKYCHWLQPKSYEHMLAQLNISNAFLEPELGKLSWR